MEKKDYRLFVDSDVRDPLPPIYKGKKITLYPGQLTKSANYRKGIGGSRMPSSNKSRSSGLRRYVFRYEGDRFVYLATRKGQRNGGFNSRPSQTKIEINFLDIPGQNNISNTFSFTRINDDNEEVWTSSPFNRIKYNSLSNRWEWQTRPVPPTGLEPGPFFVNAYTQTTSNPLKSTSSKDLIQWTYVNDPWDTATPEIPIPITEINALVWYNNNSLENLNKWPIKNVDADTGGPNNSIYKWQNYDRVTGILTLDRRPDDLSDEYLKRCFQGINLKNYDIVFVEVVWRYFAIRNKSADLNNGDGLVDWGYNGESRDEIHNFEWWSPRPFQVKRQKGRVYRIGILEADTGVGGFDKVLFAQRTRVITTDYRRGGETALQ